MTDGARASGDRPGLLARLARHAGSAPAAIFIRAMRLTVPPTHWILPELAVVRSATASFYLYRSDDALVAFDSGYGGCSARRELATLAIDPGEITHVFLTHSDLDHVGGSALFVNATVFIAEAERALFVGDSRRALRHRNRLPREDVTLLRDGAEVPIGASMVRAVITPGHTPGSMCFLVDGELLFSGDTLSVKDGTVFPPRRLFTMDVQQRLRSVEQLPALGATSVFTGHSGYFMRAAEQVRRPPAPGAGTLGP